ncbi:peptidoglycan editing factor PgeF [Gehongia tenuis]|uniref:Purine nucleoside phosphorylase n=1 Tax=Gehongia tenuis TaxID=2763655 RepID=A0A926D341_9FIRM|nr:peptidoglycan editing factor PgeF [Gehongia tenuis]MBC8530873.1 peptidoglycan editing factor PgeF [Gehongia tenuis]
MSWREGLLRRERNGVVYFTAESFERTGLVAHAFTSKLGGVSEGECESLNFGFSRKDEPERVLENYRRMAEVLGVSLDSYVSTLQVHEDRVWAPEGADRGMGVLDRENMEKADALITDLSGLTLVKHTADCVPVLLLDPAAKAVSAIHAGWRGTAKRIAQRAVEAMARRYGSKPENILAAIGPSIGPCCFEVDEPVYGAMAKAGLLSAALVRDKKNGHYDMDLWRANARALMDGGLLAEHITIAGLCTRCRGELFFSHRRDRGKTGSLAAMIALKGET